MKERGKTEGEQPFWTIDEALGDLDVMERSDILGTFSVRLKARANTSPYRAKQTIYPLSQAGTAHEVTGKAYILVPSISLTVDLYPGNQPSGAIGAVTCSSIEGMRHHDIANVRALFYQEDRALAIWEVDAWGKLDEFAHGRLWHLFEGWVVERYPEGMQIFADDAEPGDNMAENRQFLRSLGYRSVPGTRGIFARPVLPRT